MLMMKERINYILNPLKLENMTLLTFLLILCNDGVERICMYINTLFIDLLRFPTIFLYDFEKFHQRNLLAFGEQDG